MIDLFAPYDYAMHILSARGHGVFSPQLSSWFIVALAIFLFCFAPFFVHAQNVSTFPDDQGKKGLVPCGDSGDPECNVCQVESLMRDLLKLVIYTAIFLATLMIAYAGFKMVTAQGDPGAITAAKDILFKVVIGLMLVLGAWLIVDTLMRVFFRQDLGAWNSFGVCQAQPKGTLQGGTTTGGVSVGGQQGTSGPTKNGGTDAENRALLAELGIPVNKTQDQGTSLNGTDRNLLQAVGALKTDTGESLTITAGTESGHQNACHQNGTCVDVVCTSCGDSVTKLNEFITAAKSRNYCAVYEPKAGTACPAGVSPCRTQTASGNHFSLYMSSGSTDSLCRN